MVSPINVPGAGRPGSEAPAGNVSGGRVDRAAGGEAQRGQPLISESKNRASTPIRTADDAINLLRARLEQRMEQTFGSNQAVDSRRASGTFEAGTFEPPSASMVAGRILGFVQQRLQAEAQSGADPERLAGLLSDARAGVEQGFAEAREQLVALGMMNGQLSADIDNSYNRIQDGLADMNARFVTGEKPEAQAPAAASASGYRLEAASESLFSFEVTTEEGDRVTVQMAEQRYAGAGGNFQSADGAGSGQFEAISAFSGRYSISVEGDLNAEEQQALAQLFGQVEKVSSRFFEGDIQGAFKGAQALGFDGDALASFSLSLTSTRVVSAAAYESVAQQPSASSSMRPLGGLAQDLQALAQSALDQRIQLPEFEGLMATLLEGLRERQSGGQSAGEESTPAKSNAPDSLMNEFMSAVIQSLGQAGSIEKP